MPYAYTHFYLIFGATWPFTISVCQLLVGHGTAHVAWLCSSLNHPCNVKVTVVVVERQMSFFSKQENHL
jgi:hypothetical protein